MGFGTCNCQLGWSTLYVVLELALDMDGGMNEWMDCMTYKWKNCVGKKFNFWIAFVQVEN
jgi:hypothetical protein